MEMAMKLLEKDVHEKQDTMVTLRAQLEDIKAINLELVTKLAECEKSLSYKTDLIQRLEIKSVAMGDTLQQLDTKFVESERSCIQMRTTSTALLEKVMDKEGLAAAKQEIDFLRQVSRDYDNLRQENAKLREQAKEGEQTLEELGQQLSWSKLQVDSMKEEVSPPGAWTKDSEAVACKLCSKEFNIARRKHHCRNCGGIFCDGCSDNKMQLPSSSKPLRVCDTCYTLLINKQSKVL